MQLLDTLARLGAPQPYRPEEHAVATVLGPTQRFGVFVEPASSAPVLQLVQSRYGWRGLQSGPPAAGDRLTFAARAGRQAVGTLSVAFDGPAGLAADQTFPAEVQALRKRGRRLCEFTRLAVDAGSDGAALLAGLFHVAYIAAHRLRAASTLLMEVHPRHVRYYERLIGCSVIGQVRPNRRVGAPAVLLAVNFSLVRARLRACAERREGANERSIYVLGFTADEEDLILCRLLMQPG